jgi:23S rRNA (uracil1939-C5)-methyltransferase
MMPTLVLKVDRPAYGGLYIATHEGKIVMISGAALPGETVEVTVQDEKRDYIRAVVRKILKPSPFRIGPACKYFGACGGCQLQHIPFKMQIKLKEDVLRDCLKRQAKTEANLSGPVIYDNPWNYRLRGQFKVSHGAIGFYKENTREVVDIDNCPLMTKDINEYLEKIRAVIKNMDVEEIHITAGEGSAVALIKSTARIKSLSGIKVLASMFLDLGFSGLFIEAQDKKISRFGKEYITLKLPGDQKYTVSPITFLQSHWRLNQAVVEFIKNCLKPLKGKRLLDIYAGAGNFSIPLATDADVTAVEENPYAIADGKRNIEINNISNCRFINSSAENFNTKDNFDITILDPPRGGIANKLMERILSINPEEIVYISCNPSTLARDLKKLLKRYNLESVRLIDFFPQTFHIESLAHLRLR